MSYKIADYVISITVEAQDRKYKAVKTTGKRLYKQIVDTILLVNIKISGRQQGQY